MKYMLIMRSTEEAQEAWKDADTTLTIEAL